MDYILPNAPHALSKEEKNDKFGWVYFNENDILKFEEEFKLPFAEYKVQKK